MGMKLTEHQLQKLAERVFEIINNMGATKQPTAYQKIDSLPKGSTFEDAKNISGVFDKSKHSWSEVIETFEKNKYDSKYKIVNINDIKITQPNIQSGKAKSMIDNANELPAINAVQFPDGISIYDGHHRLITAWALGKKQIKVNLVTVNN